MTQKTAAASQPSSNPATKEAMDRQGNQINIRTPEETAVFFKAELEKYARLVKAAGIEPQ